MSECSVETHFGFGKTKVQENKGVSRKTKVSQENKGVRNRLLQENKGVRNRLLGKQRCQEPWENKGVRWENKGVRNRLLTFGNRFDTFHGSWDDQTER